jgi:hypothetical protein
MPTTFDAVFYALAFIVPGFVFDAARHMGARTPDRNAQRSVVQFLTASVVNYALWSWLVFLLIQPDFLRDVPHRSGSIAALWGWVILASPALLGTIAARLSRVGTTRRFLRWLGLKPLHNIPAAWDYVFHDLRRVVWVYVTLKDGSVVAGLFGGKSFASSDPRERDLYIEQVYEAAPNQLWTPVPGGAGLLISGSEVRHIEMWENTDERREVHD